MTQRSQEAETMHASTARLLDWPRHLRRYLFRREYVTIITVIVIAVGLWAVPMGNATASAAVVTFDGGAESYKVFGPNVPIVISGDLAGGCVDQFGQYSAKVYVVPHGTIDPTLPFKLSGQPNAVINSVLTDGAFLDETIGFTGPSGKTGAGNYDIVLDTCGTGSYVPGLDSIAGGDSTIGAFVVSVPANVPALPGILAMKANAAQASVRWGSLAKDTSQLYMILDYYYFLYGDFLDSAPAAIALAIYEDGVCSALPQDPRIKALQFTIVSMWCGTAGPADIYRLQMSSLNEVIRQSEHYKAIANDPPDPNFTKLVTLGPVQNPQPNTADPVEAAVTRFGGRVSQEGAELDALVHAMEKYQGAQIAGDGQAALQQAQTMQQFATQLARDLPTTSTALGDLNDSISSNKPHLEAAAVATNALQERLRSKGFTTAEVTTLLGSGLNIAGIAQLRSLLTETAAANPQANYTLDGFLASALPNDATAISTLAGSLTQNFRDLSAQLTSNIENLSGQVTSQLPHASIGGPYQGQTGVPLTLAASNSTTPPGSGTLRYEWDLNGDGSFNDAIGPTPTYTFASPREGLVGVRVTNASGYQSVAYAPIKILPTIDPPTVSAISPVVPQIITEPGQTVTFSATVGQAGGGTPAEQWSFDGTPTTASPTYSRTFTSNDIGIHVVKLTVTGPGGTRFVTRGLLVGSPVKVTAVKVTAVGGSGQDGAGVPVGSKLALKANVIFSEGSSLDITDSANWKSSDPSVATVDSGGSVTSINPGSATIAASDPSSDVSGAATITVLPQLPSQVLTRIDLTPVDLTLALNGTLQLHATGVFADGSSADITSSVRWVSNTPGVATIDQNGLASAAGSGQASVSATLQALTGTTRIVVPGGSGQLTSIVISPPDQVLPHGAVVQYRAVGTYSDNSVSDVTSTVTWSSTNTVAVAIDAAGQATIGSQGTATISATIGAITSRTSATASDNPATSGVTTLYVTEHFGGGIAKVTIDTAGHATVQPTFVNTHLPSLDSLVFDHHGHIVVSDLSGTISLFDMNTGAVAAAGLNSATPIGNLADLAMDPNSDSVFGISSNRIQGPMAIVRISLTDGAVTPLNIDNVASPMGLAITPDGSRLFVASAGRLNELDPVTGHLVRSLDIGVATWDGMTVDPTTGHLFASCAASLCEFDLGTQAAPKLTSLSSFDFSPGTLDGISADGLGNIYAVNYIQNQIEKFDIAHQLVTHITSDVPAADDVAPLAGAGAPPLGVGGGDVGKPSVTTLTYAGDAVGDVHDSVTIAATLTEAVSRQPVAAVPVNLSMGSQSCSALTNGDGMASCKLVAAQSSGAKVISAQFAGTASYQPAALTTNFTLRPDQTSLKMDQPSTVLNGDSLIVSGVLTEDGTGPLVGQPLTFTVGSGQTTQQCIGETDIAGRATCVVTTLAQSSGTVPIRASFAGTSLEDAATDSASLSVQEPSQLRLITVEAGEYDDLATISAELLDPAANPAAPVSGASVTFTAGQSTCAGVTDSRGVVRCAIHVRDGAGTYPLTVRFAGDVIHAGSTTTGQFSVSSEQTSLVQTTAPFLAAGSPGTLSAVLTEDANTPIAGKVLQLGIAGGPTCMATTGSGGKASCTVGVPATLLGPARVTAAFAGDSSYMAADAIATTTGYATNTPGRGQFVLGDSTALHSVGPVTFWGSTWGQANTLSGGSAPSSFKGYADSVSAHGTSAAAWSTAPGNSSTPPQTVPTYLAVILTSRATKNGATIDGNVVGMAIIRTDIGYGPAPGHTGTGTVVGFVGR